jgi:hypothetical protein
MNENSTNYLQPGDIVGDMFLMRSYRNVKAHRKYFSTRCIKCNRIKEISEYDLRNNPNASKHGIACSRDIKSLDPTFYDTFMHLKSRINNPNDKEYHRYGGRGLTTDYEYPVDFFDACYAQYVQMKARYPGVKLSIDRVNNNLGYVDGNISWGTPIQQTRNSTTVREFIAEAPNGQLYLTNNQLQFAARHNLDSKRISDCLRGEQSTTGGGWKFYNLNPLFVYNFDNDSRFIKELYY